jgi:hypothetical protein
MHLERALPRKEISTDRRAIESERRHLPGENVLLE